MCIVSSWEDSETDDLRDSIERSWQVKHMAEGTTLSLENGTELKCRLLVDCTGHYTELVERDGVHNPGVQIAYGAEVEVKGLCASLYVCLFITLCSFSARSHFSSASVCSYSMPVFTFCLSNTFYVFCVLCLCRLCGLCICFLCIIGRFR